MIASAAGAPSTLDPASEASREIADLWWIMMTGAWVVSAVVVALLAVAVLRRRSRPESSDGRATTLVLCGGLVAPLVVLSALFALTIRTLPATSAPKAGSTELTVRVIGSQWFWTVRYPATPGVTANEIHVPAGTRVRLRVSTADVIHSFWVPRLNRKIDMVPGRINEIVLRADRPGVYRGQCAEYCGLQHAHMAFLVVADPPVRFRAWLSRQARPAAEPASATERRGLGAFAAYGCDGCHTIRGTPAAGTVGPDLTHVAGRSTIAAGTLPNRGGYLAGWILDPQHVKPGSRMPGLDVGGADFRALLAYLDSLR